MMVHIIVGVICGIISAAIASSKGRSVVAWLLLGFLFGLIPLIIVACLPNLKEQQAYRRNIENKSHRLREQLRQEQLKSESFRRYTVERIDTHDKVLGVDTRSRPSLPPSLPSSNEDALQSLAFAANPNPVPVSQANDVEVIWYYEVEGRKKGPVSARDIKQMLAVKQLQETTLLWTKGLHDWTPVSEIKLGSW
ncbi:MAG: DUF4339 domain-containing protein [Phycisphaerae bacterium]|nr:DUF4339 domain-containing protein [Phycisphaerae bacterium]